MVKDDGVKFLRKKYFILVKEANYIKLFFSLIVDISNDGHIKYLNKTIIIQINNILKGCAGQFKGRGKNFRSP